MIAPLRRRHYQAWLALSVLLPLGLALSLLVRKPPPKPNIHLTGSPSK
jgi:hypothetical protein